jgi:hypothetical protein
MVLLNYSFIIIFSLLEVGMQADPHGGIAHTACAQIVTGQP